MGLSNLSSNVVGNESDFNITDSVPRWVPVLAGYRVFSDVANIIGNVIVVVLIYKDCKMKTTIGKLLGNLAVADGLTGLVFLMGTSIVKLSASLGQNGMSGIALMYMKVVLGALYSESLQTLGSTAFSLYMAICHSVKYRIYNKTCYVAVFIATTWTINTVVAGLFFAADDTFRNGDLMLFTFYRHHLEDIWYEVLKMVVMFLPPLLGVVCFVGVMMFKRAIREDDVQVQSGTIQLVQKSLGVLFMTTVYIVAFLVQIVGENIMPIDRDGDTGHDLRILRVVVYQYLVFKLPLFLLFFKNYRKLARRMCCPCLSRK